MARQGEKIVTATDFEARLRNLEAKMNSIGSSLSIYNNITNKAYGRALIQVGTTALAAGGTTITFDQAFAATPIIICTPLTYCFCAVTAKSASQFDARCWDDAGVATAQTVDWIAVGFLGV